MDILFAVLLLGIVAFIFGILILFASKKLTIKEDPTIAEISRLLSNANCGGCGYAGCQAFAVALAKGEAKISDCSSTKAENKEKILSIIGSDETIGQEMKIVVACSGGSNCADKYEYQGYGDCASIELLANGRKACINGCIGAANCVKACAYDAITLTMDGYADVNQNKCRQCNVCLKNCPKRIIKKIPKSAGIYIKCSSHQKGKDVRSICTFGCIGCGICEKNCPEKAITMDNNLPIVDYSKCTACGVCVGKCPAKCIVKV